ncbi:MAG: hypothetical protein IJJ33_16725 [Victivallales bacterium]|nr:hypothetical protein [Victivallales bacterium]
MELLDIEKELAGPDGAAALERYDKMLVKLDERLTLALNQGLPPDEYASAAELQAAVPLARKLLRLGLRKGPGA